MHPANDSSRRNYGPRIVDDRCQLIQEQLISKSVTGLLSMPDGADSGTEIRRILLLTKLRESAKGMTMEQIVQVCQKVPGWNISGTRLWEGVREVLQTLINDQLVDVKTRFLITSKGLEYLANPLRWKLNIETSREAERRLFWKDVYEVFNKAYARLRTWSQEDGSRKSKRK